MAPATPNGLTSVEARQRLLADGPNILPQAGRRTWLRIAWEIATQPMFALLLAAAAIYFVLGNFGEALLLLAFACTSVGIAIIQEGRSERVLEALRDLTSPRALVIRDGEQMRIPGPDVVRGDLIMLAEGDRVPADALLYAAEDLQADESLLTGEAVPVRKMAAASSNADINIAPGGEDLPLVFSGTMIVRGSGMADVTATGPRSRIGQIGRSLADIEKAVPRLTQETRNVVRSVAVMGLVCCVATVILFTLFRGGLLGGILAGIALGMSMLPEEFPLVLTVFMVMGARRLSRARVLTRRASAIETLGSATVLCTDKTGTLTENRMHIAELRLPDGGAHVITHTLDSLPAPAMRLIEHGVLASAIDPFDPMEKAFHLLRARLSDTAPASDKRLARTYPLRPELLAVTQAWAQDGADEHVVAVKGAPEAVIELCRLDAATAAAIRRNVDDMATAGMRVLGVAEARHLEELPATPRGFDFTFLGLVGLADPLRESVPAAVRECQGAGIRVLMITGDYPQTAKAIAARAGLDAQQVLTGAEIAGMSDETLQEVVGRVTVFARIMPDQKLRLVRALKARGEIVAMTGDGVNDAPALRAADIGIAMGTRGTDVAREAAQLVLLDDNFASIVQTVRLGRRIYDNLRKAMGYIMAVHIPIAGMALLPLLTGLPIIFAPVHIAFLEMVIDPVCSVVFEAEGEEGNVMRRPPRPADARLLSGRLVQWAVIQGVAALFVVAAIFLVGAFSGMAEPNLRAMTFSAIICTNLALVLVNRSFGVGLFRLFAGANLTFWIVAGLAVSLLLVATLLPSVEHLFAFGAFRLGDALIVAAATLSLILVLEAVKALWPERFLRGLSQ